MSGAPGTSQYQTWAYNKHTHEGASQKNNTKNIVFHHHHHHQKFEVASVTLPIFR
jgi:hypothetical protein